MRNKSVCALFVTYNPDDSFAQHIIKMLPQVDKVVVVDNGSNEKAINILKAIINNNNNIIPILNKSNLGIASALNQGMRWIKKNNYSFALTLDQDTMPFCDQVDYLLEVYKSSSRDNPIGIVGSNYIGTQYIETIRYRYDPQKYLWKEKKTIITSGSLIPVLVYEKVGPFREDFFIDHVDHEYCLRVRSKGLKVIVGIKPIMRHSIGQQSTHYFLFWKFSTSNHVAERHYYGSRNYISLIREYFFKEPLVMLKLSIVKIITTLTVCLYEKDKWQKLKNIIRGYRDGILQINKSYN